MKAFINLLIETDVYNDPESEEEVLEVIWSKSKEAEDK